MKRHNLVEISTQGRQEIFKNIKETPCNLNQGNLKDMEVLIVEGYSGRQVPGIVRRADEDEETLDENIAVGFSSPCLYGGRRLRIPARITKNQIEKMLTPYDILQLDWSLRTGCLKALKEIKEEALKRDLQLGVWGSAGLEVYTKLPYTHQTSDLDLLLTNADYSKILEFNHFLTKMAEKYRCKLDLELELANGYGIKSAELFMHTEYILAKSLSDVKLLTRKDVLDNLRNG